MSKPFYSLSFRVSAPVQSQMIAFALGMPPIHATKCPADHALCNATFLMQSKPNNVISQPLLFYQSPGISTFASAPGTGARHLFNEYHALPKLQDNDEKPMTTELLSMEEYFKDKAADAIRTDGRYKGIEISNAPVLCTSCDLMPPAWLLSRLGRARRAGKIWTGRQRQGRVGKQRWRALFPQEHPRYAASQSLPTH